MKQSLKTLFKQYSKVLDVVAHKNIRMRGQAFVTLDSIDAAIKAVKEVQAFPLYGKPMVRSGSSRRREREAGEPQWERELTCWSRDSNWPSRAPHPTLS